MIFWLTKMRPQTTERKPMISTGTDVVLMYVIKRRLFLGSSQVVASSSWAHHCNNRDERSSKRTKQAQTFTPAFQPPFILCSFRLSTRADSP